MHAKRRGLQRLLAISMGAFIAFGTTLLTTIAGYATDGIAAIANASYTEQADPVVVAPTLTLTDANSYAGQSVQASITSRDAGETLSLIEDETASTVAGAGHNPRKFTQWLAW